MHLGQQTRQWIRVPRQDRNLHDVVLDVGTDGCVIRVDARQLSELGVTDLMGTSAFRTWGSIVAPRWRCTTRTPFRAGDATSRRTTLNWTTRRRWSDTAGAGRSRRPSLR